MDVTDRIVLTLNGRRVEARGCSVNMTLLEWLRRGNWTGTKEGCAEGDCGACTVVVVDREPGGRCVFRSVNSCIAMLATMEGREVWTVEGIGLEGPHPVQRAMVDQYGSQCGFCTPGFVTSLFEGYYREGIETVEDLHETLSGNLCRCTGYRPIRDAARAAWLSASEEEKKGDPFGQRLEKAEVPANGVAFGNGEERFFQPGSLAEFFELRQRFPEAVWVAGGTEVGVWVAKMFRRYPVWIGLGRVRELQEVRVGDDFVELGGGVSLTDVMPVVRERFPSFYEMLRWFASRPIRNRATLGGNLATASPIGDTAPVLISLGARLRLVSPNGEREVALRDFFTGYRKTVLEEGELIRSVWIPRAAGRRVARSFKVSKRREMDISIVSAGFCVDLDEAGRVVRAGIGYGGVAATPLAVSEAERLLVGKVWGVEGVEEVAEVIGRSFEPITDGRGTKEFRSRVAVELWRGFVAEPERKEVAVRLADLPRAPCWECPRHESATKHVDGSARYVDDEAEVAKALHVWPVVSPHARARILRRDRSAAEKVPGVVKVLLAEDVPGMNDTGAVRHDEPLLAKEGVEFVGQVVAAVVGETPEACREGAKAMVVEYEPLTPVLTIEEALQAGEFHTAENVMRRGETGFEVGSGGLRFGGEFSF
ncbi:MAG: xanthine dehydrogenase small subunit, partial [Verrucomicrobiia bacterium]